MSAISEQTNQPQRAAAAAFIGTAIEWYDFYIYATAAALVFGTVFFPSEDPFISTMASFGTFAVGFFARPFGAVIFGHLGDRFGRKKALMATLVMMGVATVGVGLMPTNLPQAWMAPALLILLRILQGISAGGEWGGAVLMAGEHAPAGRRTYFASFAQLGSPAGLIASILAFRAVSSLPQEDFLSWGWRLPFLASAVLLLVGIFIRLGVKEFPEFEAARRRNEQVRMPVIEAVRSSGGMLLLCIGANVIGVAGVYFTNTFMISYTTTYLEISRSTILDALLVVAIIQFCVQPLAARLSEKIGDARFLTIMGICAALSPYPMFLLVQLGSTPALIAGIATAVVFLASFYSVIAGFVSAAFPTQVRYSAISLSYHVCAAIAGGLTPLAGTWLAHKFVGQWWPLALFYSALALLSVVSVTAIAWKQRGIRAADARAAI